MGGFEASSAQPIAEPKTRGFDRSQLRSEVDVDEAESRPVTVGPFEVVHQGPGEITFYIDAFLFGPQQGKQVLPVIVDPGLVMYGTVNHFILEGGPAFTD